MKFTSSGIFKCQVWGYQSASIATGSFLSNCDVGRLPSAADEIKDVIGWSTQVFD